MAGDVIAEIETDKATMEFEAVDEGRSARSSCPKARRASRSTSRSRSCSKRARTRPALEKSPRARRPRRATPPQHRPTGRRRPLSPIPLPASGREARDPRQREGEGQQPAARGNGDGRDLRHPAGAPHGRAGRARPRRDPRHRPAWPHRQGRYRAALGAAGARLSRAPAAAARRSSPRRRCWRSPATRPTAKCRTPRCGGSSPAGSPNRSRPSRIST